MMKLKYEFSVTYKDGTRVEQNFGEQNELMYKDIKFDEIDYFELTDGVRSYSVHLKDGHFLLNKNVVRFDLGLDKEAEKYNLVYFRRVRKDFFANETVTTIRYCLGWNTIIDGKEFNRLVFIEPDDSLTITDKK